MLFHGARDSLRRRMSRAQISLVVLMLIPALIAITLMMVHARDYHSVIEHMAEVSAVRPMIQGELLDELMDVVYGRKSFEEGRQLAILHSAQAKMDGLIESDTASRLELEVSRRVLDTIGAYVTTLAEGGPVDAQMALNDEIKNVAALFDEMLQEAIHAEINAAAEKSARIQFTIRVTLGLETAILLVSLLFATSTQRSLSKAVRVPLSQMEAFASRIAGGELSVRAQDTGVEELRTLTQSLNTMAFKLEALMEENRREQENLKKSELRALQAQITPHFLYNTLEAITWLAEAGKTQEVIEITGALSDFFRISLSNGKDWVTVAEEWQHLEGYLTIQRIRYRDILQYTLEMDESLKQEQMLKLLIQPLVENALYHGIKNRRGGGFIRVLAERTRDGTHLRVSVADSGAGMSRAQLQRLRGALASQAPTEAKTGYGLYSVDKRIKLYYNQGQGLEIESDEGTGTTVQFCVPIRGLKHAEGISG